MTREREPMKQGTVLRPPKFMPTGGSAPAELAKFRLATRPEDVTKPSASPAAPPPPAPQAQEAATPAKPPPFPPEALERLAGAIELLRLQCSKLAEQSRSDALEIGFQIAHRILEAEVRTSPESLFTLVRSAVRKAGESQRVVVRLSPTDAANLKEWSAKVGVEGAELSAVEIQADATLSPGDCMVDADFGTVDGRLESRLQEMRRAIDEAQGEVG